LSPVQWLGPHRTATWVAKPNRTIGRETSWVSHTWMAAKQLQRSDRRCEG